MEGMYNVTKDISFFLLVSIIIIIIIIVIIITIISTNMLAIALTRTEIIICQLL